MPFVRKKPLEPGEEPKALGKSVSRAPSGTPNYKEVRSDFVWVYKRMGGKKALLAWASHSKDAQETFYRELLRLVPKEMAEVENPTGNISLVMNIDKPKEYMEPKKIGLSNSLRSQLDIPKFS